MTTQTTDRRAGRSRRDDRPDAVDEASTMDAALALRTPLGRIVLHGGPQGLTRLDLPAVGFDKSAGTGTTRPASWTPESDCSLSSPLRDAARQLDEYFGGLSLIHI